MLSPKIKSLKYTKGFKTELDTNDNQVFYKNTTPILTLELSSSKVVTNNGLKTNNISPSSGTDINLTGDLRAQDNKIYTNEIRSKKLVLRDPTMTNEDNYFLRTDNNKLQLGLQTELRSNNLYMDTDSDFRNVLEKGKLTTQELILMQGLEGDNARLQVRNNSSNNVLDVDTFSNTISSQTLANLSGLNEVYCNLINPTNIKVNSSIGTSGQVLGKNESNVLSWVDASTSSSSPSVSTFNYDRTLWVSSNNTNESPNGSFINPFVTIQQAVNHAEANYDSTKNWLINVMYGIYSGFTLTKGRIFINGLNTTSDITNLTRITTNIFIALTTTSENTLDNVISISNFYIHSGDTTISSGIFDGLSNPTKSTDKYSLFLTNVFMKQLSNNNMISLNPNSEYRLNISNSRFEFDRSSSSIQVLVLSGSAGGLFTMKNSSILTNAINSCVAIGGSTTVNLISDCTFTNTNTTISTQPLISISTANTNTSPMVFIRNRFIFTSTTDKSGSIVTVGISLNTTGSPYTIHLLQNIFQLAGTTTTQNVLRDSQTANTTLRAMIYHHNNSASYLNANLIQGTSGANKFSFSVAS
jgi:hypothetical protein